MFWRTMQSFESIKSLSANIASFGSFTVNIGPKRLFSANRPVFHCLVRISAVCVWSREYLWCNARERNINCEVSGNSFL